MLADIAAMPAERLWKRVRRAVAGQGPLKTSLIYTLGGILVGAIYLFALGVIAVACYGVFLLAT